MKSTHHRTEGATHGFSYLFVRHSLDDGVINHHAAILFKPIKRLLYHLSWQVFDGNGFRRTGCGCGKRSGRAYLPIFESVYAALKWVASEFADAVFAKVLKNFSHPSHDVGALLVLVPVHKGTS